MAMTVTAFSHKTLLGLNRICIRFAAKPDASILQAVKTFGAKYRKAKDAPACWYLPADKVDALAQHLGAMTVLNSGEVDRLSAALAPFTTPDPDTNESADEAAPEAEAEAAPETAPEDDGDGMPRKRLRVTDCRQVRECRACVYEAQMMAQDVGGFAQMYHTCVESESQ